MSANLFGTDLRSLGGRLLHHLASETTPKNEITLPQMIAFHRHASLIAPMISLPHALHQLVLPAIVRRLSQWLLRQAHQQQLYLYQHMQEHLQSLLPDHVPPQDLFGVISAHLVDVEASVVILEAEEVLVARHFAAAEEARLSVQATAVGEQR